MPKRKPTRQRQLRVEVEAEPKNEIDLDLFAWTLLQYCRIKIERGETEDSAP
jgi:hypothetical protein